MAWIKVDDQMVDHPKIAPLSDAAFRWTHRALSYANRFLTNGKLPQTFIDTVPVGILAELTTPSPGQKHPVWDHARAGAWRIHDFQKYQRSKAQVERAHQLNTDRQKKFRNGVTDTVRNGVTDASPQRPRNGPRTQKNPTYKRSPLKPPLTEAKLEALERQHTAVEAQKAAAKTRETP